MHFKVSGHEEFYSEVTRARWNRFPDLNYNSIRLKAFRGPMTSGDKVMEPVNHMTAGGKLNNFPKSS